MQFVALLPVVRLACMCWLLHMPCISSSALVLNHLIQEYIGSQVNKALSNIAIIVLRQLDASSVLFAGWRVSRMCCI